MSITPNVGVSSELVEIKLCLMNIKELLISIENTLEMRFNNVVKLLGVSQNSKSIADKYSSISSEFSMLRDEIMETRNKFKTIVKNYEITCQLITVAVAQDTARESRVSMERQSTSRRSTITCSVTDERKLADNLRAMLKVVENFEKENNKLKEDNQKISNQLFELLNAQLGSAKDEKQKIPAIKFKPTTVEVKPITLKPELDKETSFSDLKSVICSLKEELENTYIVYAPTKSISTLFFNYRDVSFNWNESETVELSEEEWKFRLSLLRRNHESMALIDAKLTAIKTVGYNELNLNTEKLI